MAASYPIAREANGSCVLCQSENGQLLFFAPDQTFEDLKPYGHDPMYTLHTKDGAGTQREWVERIAEQCLRHTMRRGELT